ncbi:hypothetical protein [Shewanella nanhaiensis]|uniref:Uncharacterized protein n=1 Tax=Shewanella nanhaiensis TaxID=2864872 RepID=A0ABS7E1I2_9GAMM|nr:hypothetical protein [Shewanella nanhaiensis]MBW8183563.1 hypothetical protein [Shewanella nanhaiensis]
MSGIDGTPWCALDDLQSYLEEIDSSHLLKYIKHSEDQYSLNKEEFDKQKTPSVRIQIACVFAILGEHSIAQEIHELRWGDLSSWGDKVTNGMLKKFMQP